MKIQAEIIQLNGKEFKLFKSLNNKIIRKTGTNEEYIEAVDILEASWEYEETDKDIETDI